MARRILIIGAGAISRHHAAAAQLLGDVEILVADPSAEARAGFAEAFPEATTFDDVATMLSARPAGQGDVVVVAVPPWLHAPMALQAFAAGYHVLCEKPLGRSLEEVDAILDAAAAAGREIGDCAIRFNDQPSMRRARAHLDAGELGRPNLVRMVHRIPRMRPGIEYQPASRWFLSREHAGGGVLMDWSVYDISMLFDVLRPVRATVTAAWAGGIDGRDDPPEFPVEVESHAAAMLTLELSNGARLPVFYERANGVNGPSLSELSVEGTSGGLSWQWLPPYENGTIRLTRFVDAGGKVVEEDEVLPMEGVPHFHHRPLLALIDRIDGKASPALDPDMIRFNFAVVEAIGAAARSGTGLTVGR